MSGITNHKLLISIVAASLTSVAACGAHRPPQELVDARAAYAHASSSNAQKLVPAELHVARTSLDDAERKFGDDGDSQPTKDLAYVAMRKSQRAEALGNAAAADAARAQYGVERSRTQDQIIADQRGQLRTAQGEIAQQQAETAAEHQARVDAEKKAKDSMDALSKSLAVKADTRGTVISLPSGVLFVTGKADILPGAQTELNQVADTLKAQAEHHFTVEGHTDTTGTNAINDALSTQRANAVRDYLVVHGVSPDAISAQGMGSNHPIGDNKTTEGRAMNRRVEIIVDHAAVTAAASASR
jgi:outer membrane protein OmpA-like peptidoglycan-associated protein